MVGFRNQVGIGEAGELMKWFSPSSQQIAFERGTYPTIHTSPITHAGSGADGFVVINNADTEWSTTFTTSLPGGSYCNAIDSWTSFNGTCTGTAYISFWLLLPPTF